MENCGDESRPVNGRIPGGASDNKMKLVSRRRRVGAAGRPAGDAPGDTDREFAG